MALERWDNLSQKSKGFDYYIRRFGWISWVFIIGFILYRVNLHYSRPSVIYAPVQSAPVVQSPPPVQSVHYKTFEDMCIANPSYSDCSESSPVRKQRREQALLIFQQKEKKESQLVSTAGGGYSGYIEYNGKRQSVYSPAVTSQTFRYRSVNNIKHLDVEINGVPVEMILDTGASDVFVDGDVLRRLGIKAYTGSKMYQTFTGAVKGYNFPVSVKLGFFEVQNIDCGYQPSNPHNLLGGSFLKHFNYEINESSGTITFTAK